MQARNQMLRTGFRQAYPPVISHRQARWRIDHSAALPTGYAVAMCSHYQAERRRKFIEQRYGFALPSE